ncbi:MAG: GNAT family N-acetyltransferase [Opitutales bacterium]
MLHLPSTCPELKTKRLLLRPFVLEDAPRVTEIAQDREVADTTQSIPHPYTIEDARNWILPQYRDTQEGRLYTWAITLQSSREIIGATNLEIHAQYRWADLGYWLGKNYWRQGYATESARCLLEYSFKVLQVHRVQAYHMSRNAPSGRVLQKLNMRYEGTRRQAMIKWGIFEDLDYYAILRDKYLRH